MGGTDLKVSVFMELPQSKYATNRNESTPSMSRRNSASRNTAKVYIATVDLSKLGKWVKNKRRRNEMQHLYVLGQNPVGFGPLQEDSDED